MASLAQFSPFKPRDPGFDPRDPGFDPRDPGFDPRGPGFDPRGPGFDPRLCQDMTLFFAIANSTFHPSGK